MFIEVLHDEAGMIQSCCCVDTLPVDPSSRLFEMDNVPEGLEQARVNVDTITVMEIEAACTERAVINPDTGLPEIVSMDRGRYVIDNFKVDTATEFPSPSGVTLPAGLKLRSLARR